MKRIYQLSFVLLITLLFSQCDDSEKLAKPHLSLSELQEKVTTSEAYINFRASTAQNHTNSMNNITELNNADRKTLRHITEKYNDVDDFTKNASKDELEEFSKLTKAVEVENTQRYVKAFDSYLTKLKKDFDFSQEKLSLVISEGLLDEVNADKNQRRGCQTYCLKASQSTFWNLFNSFFSGGTTFFDSVKMAKTGSDYYFAGCIDGCLDNIE